MILQKLQKICTFEVLEIKFVKFFKCCNKMNCFDYFLIAFISHAKIGIIPAIQTPQVLPAASLIYPLSPQFAPQEFLTFQTPFSSTPTTTTP